MSLLFRVKRKIYKIFHPVMGEILMLHRVTNERSFLDANRELEITPDYLEKTILYYIAEDYKFISLDELYEIILKKRKLKQKFICFTMDDGYKDNYDTAYPIFKKYDCPFTIFVTTDFPNKKGLLWWYILENILLESSTLKLADNSVYDCSTMEKKNSVFREIREKIFSLQSENMQSTLDELFMPYSFPYDTENKITLSWDNIIELSKDPLCSIGSHTLTHPALTKLSDNNVLRELMESKNKLEKIINKDIAHFAYPYGIWNERILKLTASVGYKTAVLANGGVARRGDYVFMLKRNILTQK